MCGVLWAERDTSTVLVKKKACNAYAQSMWESSSAAMCHVCIAELSPNNSGSSAAPTPRRPKRQKTSPARKREPCTEVLIDDAPVRTVIPESIGQDIYSDEGNNTAELNLLTVDQNLQDAKPRAIL